ncbi:unnamed protein product [Adineta steineri]|uniref:Uncharacterized protein n=1 Tax=Adineta steineri TaxID=433720 RepID=A0A814UA79_9BILA|nr:unnamed protein product [Adineta steineri]
MGGDLPARSKCNALNHHNGFYACSRCLMEGVRCAAPCKYHTLYRWSDFTSSPPPRRTQEHINYCVKQIQSSNEYLFGVTGISPLFSLISVPTQSVFDYFHLVLEIHLRRVLSVWYEIIKSNNALKFIDDYLNEIEYPHSFNRHVKHFSQYSKWKASQLRTFMIYIAMPLLVRLRLAMPDTFPEVYLSHFSLLFIYIRVLRHFNDRDAISQVPVFIHAYLHSFSSIYDTCKELFSVHALCHLWQQVKDHGGLAYHSLFATESCLQHFAKLAHGTVALGQQICFWWCIFSQINSKQVQYTPKLLLDEYLIEDNFLDYQLLKNYQQEFDLVYYQMFNKLPDESMKYYCRYRRGMSHYHSFMYTRRKTSNSYSISVNVYTDHGESNLYYGQILFFFYVNNQPFFFFKRFNNSKTKFSSLLEPMGDISTWSLYLDKYYPIVRFSTSHLIILPCSCIVSKCFFFLLSDELLVCTSIELETEHD